jgi:hypothetical protein
MKRTFLITALCLSMMCACGDTESATGGTESNDDVAGTDTGGEPDTATPDAGAEVSADTKAVFKPFAWAFESNPIDTPELSQVELQHLDEGQYSLKGAYARVRNCLPNVETGQKIPIDVGPLKLNLTTCTPTHAAAPGEDGTYLHIKVPEDHGSGDDSFAEIMMYHHMQLIHDYFKDIHGLTDLDLPLDALVNLQVHVDLCNQWTSISNAAFIPGGTLDQFGFALDFGIEGDAIMFSQAPNKDFSYDADVIYHEYTHAMVGATRLNAVFADGQGMNNMPGALNEAYADYFAATLSNDSVVGNYALNGLAPLSICGFQLGGGGGNQSRDLANFRSCPDDLTAEVHADGEIFGSALWAVRQAIGDVKADQVILDALGGFTNTTDFNLAASFTVATAKKQLSAGDAAKVETAFTDRGLIGCQRIVPIANVGSQGIPISMLASNAMNPNPFGDYVPGYTQFGVEIPEGAQQLTLNIKTGGGGGATLAAAFKPGAKAVTYIYSFTGKPATHDAAIVLPLTAAAAGNYKVTLAGPCLKPGPLTFALHNKGGATSVTKVSQVTSKDPSDAPNFVDCN